MGRTFTDQLWVSKALNMSWSMGSPGSLLEEEACSHSVKQNWWSGKGTKTKDAQAPNSEAEVISTMSTWWDPMSLQSSSGYGLCSLGQQSVKRQTPTPGRTGPLCRNLGALSWAFDLCQIIQNKPVFLQDMNSFQQSEQICNNGPSLQNGFPACPVLSRSAGCHWVATVKVHKGYIESG